MLQYKHTVRKVLQRTVSRIEMTHEKYVKAQRASALASIEHKREISNTRRKKIIGASNDIHPKVIDANTSQMCTKTVICIIIVSYFCTNSDYLNTYK